MKFTKNSLITFVFTSSSVVFVYFIKYFIANYLGPEGEGNITLVMQYALTISFFGGFGLNIANIYFYNRDNSKLNVIFWNSILFIFVFSIVLIVIFFLLAPYILKNVNFSFIQPAYPLIVYSLFINIMISTLSARMFFLRYGIVYVLPNVIYLSIVIILVTTGNLTIINAIYSVVFSYFITFLVCFIFSGKEVNRVEFDLRFLKTSIKYGIRGHLGNIFQRFNYRLDFFIINIFTIPKKVGYYSIATAVAEILLFIPRSISTVLFPLVSSMKDEKEAAVYTARISRITLFIVFIVAVGLFLSGKFFISTFFPKFSNSIIPMYLLLPGIVFLSVANVLGNFFSGKGSPEIPAYCSFIGLVSTLVFDFILIPPFEIIGAAVASSISYMTCTFSFVYFFIKRTKLPIRSFILINRDDLKFIFKTIKLRLYGNST